MISEIIRCSELKWLDIFIFELKQKLATISKFKFTR